jgi:tetratricopeptide (TPR) repeat protein
MEDQIASLSLSQLIDLKRVSSDGGMYEAVKMMVRRGIVLPFTAFKYGAQLLITKGKSLGDDRWTLLEKLFMCAIKLGSDSWTGYCLKQLRDKFPGSERVERLAALYRESKEDWVEAENIYKLMLAKSPDNLYPRKRLIACLKAQGRINDAIGAINDQLEVFSADTELWHELSMLYIAQGSFARAASSFQEVLLADPMSFYNLLVYAEIEASVGNVSLARKYYCKALESRPNEPRALWGLMTCLQESSSSAKKSDLKEQKMLAQLKAETKRRLENIYKPLATRSAKLCLDMLARID